MTPSISVLGCLHETPKHATLSHPILLLMVYYVDRFCALYTHFTVASLTAHEFPITTAIVAAKGLSDDFWKNSKYARAGGIKAEELRSLELEFLHRAGRKIIPSPEIILANHCKGLVKRNKCFTFEGEESPSPKTMSRMRFEGYTADRPVLGDRGFKWCTATCMDG